ncbi:hypothetical protein BDN67DRAFT_983817 [Paxillus ammoniavirescens]|nr:hypothetical protein BDN67DRAFT_983817 [Paxillus ammoniavirescens]
MTLDNPWEITDSIKHAQKLWNTFIPQLKHTLCYKNDPVFYLLKQQVYNWQGTFATHAEKAVMAFFDWYAVFDNLKDQSDYIVWAVLEPTEEVDEHGSKFFVPPSHYPYMWEKFDNADPEDLTVKHLPETQRTTSSGRWPCGVLTLSVVAVEHAFGQWDTGNFVPLSKANDEVMVSVDQVSEKKWKKLFAGAQKVILELDS